MTRQEIMIQILSEVTGKSQETIAGLLKPIIRRLEFSNPGSTKGFYVELSDPAAQELISKLRAEKAGILNWLNQGSKKAHSLIERYGRQN